MLIIENKKEILNVLLEKLESITNKKIKLCEVDIWDEDITTIEGIYKLVETTLKNSNTRLSIDKNVKNMTNNNVILKGEIDFNQYKYFVNKFSEIGFGKLSPIEINGKIYDNYISKNNKFTITIPKSKL